MFSTDKLMFPACRGFHLWFVCGNTRLVWHVSHKLCNVGISAITKSIHVVEGILRPYGIIFVSYLFNAFSTPHATLLTIICYTPDCAAGFKRITLKVYIKPFWFGYLRRLNRTIRLKRGLNVIKFCVTLPLFIWKAYELAVSGLNFELKTG